MKLFGWVRNGDVIPFGTGVAWIDYVHDRALVLPVPLNVLTLLAQKAYFWALYPFRPNCPRCRRLP